MKKRSGNSIHKHVFSSRWSTKLTSLMNALSSILVRIAGEKWPLIHMNHRNFRAFLTISNRSLLVIVIVSTIPRSMTENSVTCLHISMRCAAVKFLTTHNRNVFNWCCFEIPLLMNWLALWCKSMWYKFRYVIQTSVDRSTHLIRFFSFKCALLLLPINLIYKCVLEQNGDSTNEDTIAKWRKIQMNVMQILISVSWTFAVHHSDKSNLLYRLCGEQICHKMNAGTIKSVWQH